MTDKRRNMLKFKNENPLYFIWRGMFHRCQNPKNRAFINYGQRGITICPEWENYKTFEADMGERPSLKHSLERINNDLGYFPKNCRWATKKEQQRNQRRTLKAMFDGKEYLIVELAEMAGVKPDTIQARIKRGMTFEQVISRERFQAPITPGLWKYSVAVTAKKTHCPRGHAYDTISKEGWRRCKTCQRDRERIRQRKLRQLKLIARRSCV